MRAFGLLAIGFAAMIGVSPIVNSRHELTVRHVRCAEHGELTHAQVGQGVSVERHRDFASAEGEQKDGVDGHDHCANSLLTRARFVVSVVRPLVRHPPPSTVARAVRDAAVTPGRAFVLASAPKTSPPSA